MALLDICPYSHASLGQENARLTGSPHTSDLSYGPLWPHMLGMGCAVPGAPHSTTGADGGWGGVSGGLELHSDMQGSGAEAVLVYPVAQNGSVQWSIRSACRPQAFYHIPGTPVSTIKDPTTSRHRAPGKLFHLQEWDQGLPVLLRPTLPPRLTLVLVRMLRVCQC